MSWRITPSQVVPDDADAVAYIAAVEAADGEALEPAVRLAINSFVKGCKSDAIWNAIKASCIMAGARTLAGALTPLVGTAPTNNNFWGAADAYWGNTSLLMRFNGANGGTTLSDSSSNTITLARFGNTQTSTAQSIFYGSSALFDGSGDYLQTSSAVAALDLVGGDFTIEAWIYPLSFNSGGSDRLIGISGGAVAFNSTNGIHLLFQVLNYGGSRVLQIQYYNGSGPGSFSGSIPISLNTWQHVSVCVQGTTAYLSVDGVVESSSVSSMTRPSTNPLFAVATLPGEAGYSTIAFNGYMSDLRVTKGVARYTSNFTPSLYPAANGSADYNRTTGLVGDGNTKYLDSNRADNADPQNSKHLSLYVSSVGVSGDHNYIGAVGTGGSVYTMIQRRTAGTLGFGCRASLANLPSVGSSTTTGFYGVNRSSSVSYNYRAGITGSVTDTSIAPLSINHYVFGRNLQGTGLSTPTNARLAFYSIGESLDLALLDSRVTRLVNEIAFYLNTGLSGTNYDIDTLKYINAGYAAGGTLS